MMTGIVVSENQSHLAIHVLVRIHQAVLYSFYINELAQIQD